MRIVIVTTGTRGDVQPYVALGLGLQRAGHRVRLATHAAFREFVTGRGLDFAPIAGDPQGFMAHQEGLPPLNVSGNTLRFLRQYIREAMPLGWQALTDGWNACQDADVIAFSLTGAVIGYHVAEKMGAPCYPAYLQNVIPTRAFPSYLSPVHTWGGTYNLLSYALFDQCLWQFMRPYLNELRQEALGLPPLPLEHPLERMRNQRLAQLCGFSAVVLPKPLKWGDWVHVTGFWFLDHLPGWRPPAGLVDFLESGPPPVCVGFGSTPSSNPEAMTALVLDALARTGLRGILVTGWGGLSNSDLPDEVYKIESIPYDWLFPRVTAVVHHGGVGTMSAALRAGVPSVAVPLFWDQPFWAHRLAALGAGPEPIPQKHLSAGRLAAAIEIAVGDEVIRTRAVALGRSLRAEDGVARAVEAFQIDPPRPIAVRETPSRLVGALKRRWAHPI
jgi:UDP:flavonoid glycosyltransferase YjiC (YdhE family)